ncbi:MAG: type II secretion system F family protein [Gammaproteobacteria bacterium]|nr:type II secretion system F family protein [Gammaproteobacteria bacterium]
MFKSPSHVRKPLMDAHWCRALATLLASGLSAEQALTAIKGQAGRHHHLVSACSKALVEIERGSSLVAALSQHNFFNHYQLEQLKIGELSGSLPLTLINIANRLNRQHERNQTLRTQLKFSQAIIVIGLIAGTVITAIKGGHFIDQVIGLTMIVMVTHFIYRMLDADIFSVLAHAWQRPLIMRNVKVLNRLFEYYWYSLLAAQLDAGIDPVHALRNLHDLFPSTLLKRNTRICERSLEKGSPLVAALSHAQLILTNEMKQILWTGEKTGLLAPTLKYHLELEEKHLEVATATVYEWLPRFYYLIALSVVLHFIVKNN